jgi:hypothetical protein
MYHPHICEETYYILHSRCYYVLVRVRVLVCIYSIDFGIGNNSVTGLCLPCPLHLPASSSTGFDFFYNLYTNELFCCYVGVDVPEMEGEYICVLAYVCAL